MEYAHSNRRQLFAGSPRPAELTDARKSLAEKLAPSVREDRGATFREIRSLVEVIATLLDLRGVAEDSSPLNSQCHGIVTFFQQAQKVISETQAEMNKQKELKDSDLQCYCLNLLIPALTALFSHVGYQGASRLLVQGEVLQACRQIFQSLVEMATGATPVFVGT